MKETFDKIKDMTIEEFLNGLFSFKKTDDDICKELYNAIFAKDGVDYKKLYKLIPFLDEDGISTILRFDRNYKISFLLSLVDVAYEEDLTKQAIFLLKRYNLKYIVPLLEYVDEDEIRNVYLNLKK